MLRRFRGRPVFTVVLVAVNVIIFLMSFFTGDVLHYLGGVQKTAILDYHQYGRLVFAMFLHADVTHLFNNMIIVFFLGSMLEKEIGHIRFLLIYFLSGIGGNILSLIVKVRENSEVLSIGASGAVFGLDGLLLALVMCSPRFRNTVTPGRVLLMIVLSLYDGYLGSNIDNAAHFGGLVIGFLLGLLCGVFQNIRDRRYREVQI